jgi:hypothetical protein
MDNFLFDIVIDELPTKSKTKNVQKKFEKKGDSTKKKKGGYRPVLVDDTCLKLESIELESTMKLIREKQSLKLLNDQDLVSFYIIAYLNQRYPNQFLENYSPIQNVNETNLIQSASYENLICLTNKNFEVKLEKYKSTTLFSIINNFNLHSVPHSARISLSKWYSNDFKLILMFDNVPSSRDVLAMQADGKRCISLITNNIDNLILNERDALSFLLHDLVHAYKMFSNDILLQGQIGFCRAMMKILKNKQGNNLIESLSSQDEKFSENFDYLISDMNSHTKHLFYYFKAILINSFKFKHNLKDEILNGKSLEEFLSTFDTFLQILEMNENEKDLSRKMLMPIENDRGEKKGFNVINFTILDEYFMRLYFNKS